MKQNNNYETAAKGIKVGGIFTRIFLYLFLYIPGFIVVFIIAANGGAKDIVRIFAIPNTDFAITSVIVIGLSIPFILWELSIQSWREKRSLPIWKNIEEEIKQKEVDKRIAREKKAYANNGLSQAVDKTDLGYWHELLQKGAITEDEYAAKKRELL